MGNTDSEMDPRQELDGELHIASPSRGKQSLPVRSGIPLRPDEAYLLLQRRRPFLRRCIYFTTHPYDKNRMNGREAAN